MRRRTEGWLLAGIILLGLLIRLAGWHWGQSYGIFMYGDELLAVERAVEYEQGDETARYLGQPQFNGQSKLPGPLWTLFCAAALRLTGSPSAAPLVTLLLNTALIALVWRLASRVLGREYGLWAALFTATLPWPVFYSLGLYNPVIMGFIFSWLYLALWQVYTRDRSAAVFWMAPILMGSIQVHMSGLMILPAVVVLLVLARRRVHWPWLLAGLGAGGLLFVPYLRGEAAVGWQNTAGMLAGGGQFKISALKAVSSPLNVLGGLIGRLFPDTEAYLAFGDAAFLSRYLFIPLTLVSTGMGVLFGAALVRETVRMIRRARMESIRWSRADPGVLFLAVLILVPLLSSVVSGRSFHSRYTIVLFPLLMLCPALFVVRWLPDIRRRRWLQGGLVVTVLFHLYLMPAFYRHQGRWIDESPFLAGSHPQMETIYEAVRAVTPGDHRIEIDAESFLDAGEPDRWDRQAAWMVAAICRIQDHVLGLPPDAPAVTYRLHSTRREAMPAGAAAYTGYGLVLIPADDSAAAAGQPTSL